MVRYHSLDNYCRLEGKPGIKKLFHRIGSVQYDPLNVVGRNPDLVLQSRIKNYSASLLNDLLYRDRVLIDGWDKEMSIYSGTDWPFFSRVRRQRKEDSLNILKRRGQEEVLSFLPEIISEIKKRGPLGAREIKLGATQKNRWGHRQISGAAMDFLYASGELGIHKKNNSQKVYDLTGNLLPDKILNAAEPFSDDNSFLEWYVQRRIGSMGAYWPRNGTGWLGYYLSDSGRRQNAINALEEKNLIIPLIVSELGETFYFRSKDISLLNEKENYDGLGRFLAPLDNILWDRLLLQKVFDFQYSWEVYVPQDKRKYGYYVLPVLYRNSFIARIEPFKYEKGQPFVIKNLWWEPFYDKCTAKGKKEIKEAVRACIKIFAGYLGTDLIGNTLINSG